MNKEMKLPELGDGIDSGDVLEVLVKVGDFIEREQGIVELETDKATVEVPSSFAGKITKIHVSEGQTVPIGATLITVEEQSVETGSSNQAPNTRAAARRRKGRPAA